MFSLWLWEDSPIGGMLHLEPVEIFHMLPVVLIHVEFCLLLGSQKETHPSPQSVGLFQDRLECMGQNAALSSAR